jgi:hypothetical protein
MEVSELAALRLVTQYRRWLDPYHQLHLRYMRRRVESKQELTGAQLALLSGMLKELRKRADELGSQTVDTQPDVSTPRDTDNTYDT